jgi:hypothetical protein
MEVIMKVRDAFPKKYIVGEDLENKEVELTIRKVLQEVFPDGDKLVVSFDETKKQLVLNWTNAQTITELYGDETEDWVGKKIWLFATQVDFRGKAVMATRVRKQKPEPPTLEDIQDDPIAIQSS